MVRCRHVRLRGQATALIVLTSSSRRVIVVFYDYRPHYARQQCVPPSFHIHASFMPVGEMSHRLRLPRLGCPIRPMVVVKRHISSIDAVKDILSPVMLFFLAIVAVELAAVLMLAGRVESGLRLVRLD